VATRFRDSPSKQIVREKWDTPVLRYLYDVHRVRYRYMGLPGVDLLDVKLWKDMIDDVVAFEPPDRADDRRASIIQLRRNMKLLGVPGIAYWGSFEEVVILRSDYDGQKYSQDKLVNLYNLDFCDEIASHISTRNKGKRVWRFEAIRQVLRDQVECYRTKGGPNWFVLMLTIRNQIDAKKIRQFLKNQLLAETNDFRAKCELQKPLPQDGPLSRSYSWTLKAFIFNLMCQNFANPNISALFFPLVLYTGTTASSPMLHWLIVCRIADQESHGPEMFPNPYLVSSSVSVQNQELVWAPQAGEMTEITTPPDGVGWLKDFGAGLIANFKSA
jgi:hypothetical protein